MRYLSIARKEKGYTQAQMADMLGMTLKAYQHYEYAVTNGSMRVWLELENILDVPAKKLFSLLSTIDNPKILQEADKV